MTRAATRKGTLFGVFALLAATLFWAGNYVVGGAAVTAISPLDLTAMRWAIAAVPLLLLAQVLERPSWRTVARAWPQLILPALFGLLAYNFLLYSALEHTTAVNASLINAVTLGQPITLAQSVGGLVVFAGVIATNLDAFRTPPTR